MLTLLTCNLNLNAAKRRPERKIEQKQSKRHKPKMLPAIPSEDAWCWQTYWYARTNTNFYPVEEEQCYRSNQIDPQLLPEYIRRYGITTIIRFRNDNENRAWGEGLDWMQKEETIARALGIRFYKISTRGQKLLTQEQVIHVLEIFKARRGPVLGHCKQGADRTSEFAGLWKVYKPEEDYWIAKLGKERWDAKTLAQLIEDRDITTDLKELDFAQIKTNAKKQFSAKRFSHKTSYVFPEKHAVVDAWQGIKWAFSDRFTQNVAEQLATYWCIRPDWILG